MFAAGKHLNIWNIRDTHIVIMVYLSGRISSRATVILDGILEDPYAHVAERYTRYVEVVVP